MIVTQELLDSLKLRSGEYTRHAKHILKTAGGKGWKKNLIGLEIDDEILAPYIGKYLHKHKHITKAPPDMFIELFVHNAYEGNIHGSMVPKWIHMDINWDAVSIQLQKLNYPDFLTTYYWRAIAAYMKYKNNGHCNRCPSETRLEVHHKTYDHHGMELFFMEDLEVLCSRCHEAQH